MKNEILGAVFLFGLSVTVAAPAGTLDGLLADYRSQGAGPFDAGAGKDLWERSFPSDSGGQRACTTCHADDPRQPGRHALTRKPIEPLAPSVNPQRLTDRRQIEKWLGRNCKWTLGRACTAQEKGDVLVFLQGR